MSDGGFTLHLTMSLPDNFTQPSGSDMVDCHVKPSSRVDYFYSNMAFKFIFETF